MNVKHKIKDNILKINGGEPRSLDELVACVIKVINTVTPVKGFAWDIRKGEPSNSHECPMDGVTNWSQGDKSLPTSYPGWGGRVWIRYDSYTKDRGHFGSNPFSQTLTYPGTGGFGAYGGPWQTISNHKYQSWLKDKNVKTPEVLIYSWDYKFFDSDWPELYYYELFNILNDNNRLRTHRFEWTDPAVLEEDNKFIERWKTEYV